ncbi:MAG: hypothetical protein IJ111_11500 [Eggerthellaceae bacterium]|nr:hypothetical protein [Eggerthellaceae bacterium]
MAFFLSHISAATFWRTVYSCKRRPLQDESLSPTDNSNCNARDLRNALPSWADCDFEMLQGGPFHVLARTFTGLRKSPRVKSRLWTAPFPGCSFYRLSDDLFIASPEFTFLLMAADCTLGQLIAYGCEICGKYSFDPRCDRGFRTRSVSLTTKKLLERFLESASGLDGTLKARRALHYIFEGAESPMETLVCLLLCAPYRLGGYGLEKPLSNKTIRLSKNARAIARKRNCRIDLLWEGPRLAVEFLGKYDHASELAFEPDRQRANALVEMSYTVIELTWSQVRNWEAFELIALRIARATGKRIANRDKGLTSKRKALRDGLFAWNASYGHPGTAQGPTARDWPV